MNNTFDVLVIGGGPAGIAAAVSAAECNYKVAIVDDNAQLGGQIWRKAVGDDSAPNEAANWYERLQQANITTFCGKRVFHQPEPGILLAEGADNLLEFQYRNLVVTTGARERFLPFPGWTLPNVMGAGGLQAMAKSGLPISGKRVVVAGTGPLLLAVAAYLRKHGADVPVICEQASWRRLAWFGMHLLGDSQKITQARRFKRELAGVPFAANSWPVAAHGHGVLESVSISRSGQMQEIDCGYLACGFHLVPNTELAALLGCKIRDGFVQVDDFQRTSVAAVFCAGEPTGIGGLELSILEGQIAGLTAAGRQSDAQLLSAREKLRRFVLIMDQTFSLRAELRGLASPDTIVCRCEDVTYSRLQAHVSWRAAKLHTRCGMGPCQGRICGPATQFLFGWSPDSVRPPVFPVRVQSLAADAGAPDNQHKGMTAEH